MSTSRTLEYDVVVMGTGFAALCQVQHLLLNLPHLKIAQVGLLGQMQQDSDLKLGTVEIADLFLCKELGLHNYLIERHIPRSCLSFHWPKNPACTATLDDYYHIWANRQLSIASYQIEPGKFERDLLEMNRKQGSVFYRGAIVDVELTEGGALNVVKVQLDDGEIELKAKHLIDAAGRQFVIGSQTDNLLFGPENLLGLDNGTAWLRVKNVDRDLFSDGYVPTETSTSQYYSSNHYFGYGHWAWMTPFDIESKELSVGLVHYHEVFPAEGIDTLEKFCGFLQNNHNLLYSWV